MLNKLKKFNKVQKVALLALILVLLCQLGGLTGAWLLSRDSVTNVFGLHDYFVDIILTEPDWNSVGRSQAQKMQPGMDIFKDPRVTNITEDKCFVRMQIIIADKDGDVIADGDRKDSILRAISYCTAGENTPSLSDDKFTVYSELNPDFEYYEGWFYYTESNGECAILDTGESTTPLFTDVIIPTLKSEYQYFSDGFVITVKAEAIFSDGAADKSVEGIAARFGSGSNLEDDINASGLDSATSESSIMVAVSNGVFAVSGTNISENDTNSSGTSNTDVITDNGNTSGSKTNADTKPVAVGEAYSEDKAVNVGTAYEEAKPEVSLSSDYSEDKSAVADTAVSDTAVKLEVE